ncbi:MAG: membrane integrity-associated transporter subunit PqiC [Deltaproteobacteria bacterium]
MVTLKAVTQVVVLLLALAFSISACVGKTASSKFYVLSALPQSKPSETGGAMIGVLPVAMPDHLDRPQIVTRASENEIKIDEFSRWAEPLKENFYTVLVENLSTLLNSEKVVKTAQGLGLPLTYQVGVEVLQLDGPLGGDVVLSARWALFQSEGKKLLLIKRSSFKEPTGAATYEALVAAKSRAVAALSREIAEAIKTRK